MPLLYPAKLQVIAQSQQAFRPLKTSNNTPAVLLNIPQSTAYADT